MKKATIFAATLVFALSLAPVFAQEAADAPHAPYVTDYAKAKELAADGDKPIVIDFYTDWCVWCKKFDKEVAIQPEIIEFFTNEAVYAKINAEEDTVVSKAFRVMGFPTFVLTDSKGEEIDRIAGFLETAEFLQTIDDYRNGIGTLNALLAEAENSDDRELYFQIADKYKYSGWTDDAKKWYEKIESTGTGTDSLSGEAFMAVADMYRRDDKDDDAMTIYKDVVVKFKGTDFEPQGMLYVGHMNRWGKEFDAAMNIYNTVISKFKGTHFEELGEIYRAINYRDRGDTAQAISAYAQFIEHWPNSEDFDYANEQIAKLRGE